MSVKKKYRCPFCNDVYISKLSLYDHMEKKHNDQLNNLSPANIYFNIKYKKDSGKCIVCGKKTKFNETTERYERICSETCKNRYREEFRRRMIKKYGKDKLTDDPMQQLKMQSKRKIAGVYKWSDGAKFNYLGSYEKHALEYLDKILNFRSQDILAPAPMSIKYIHNGKEKFYMPDIYIIPYNLLVEVKGTNNHYQKRDIELEKLKDKAAMNSEYNYVKVLDKKYEPLLNIIEVIKNGKSD